jgi:hypothetical protein
LSEQLRKEQVKPARTSKTPASVEVMSNMRFHMPTN